MKLIKFAFASIALISASHTFAAEKVTSNPVVPTTTATVTVTTTDVPASEAVVATPASEAVVATAPAK